MMGSSSIHSTASVEPGDRNGAGSELLSKVFLRASRSALKTYVAGPALDAVLTDVFAQGVRSRCRPLLDGEQRLLEDLFLLDRDGYTVVLPSDDHPARPLRAWQAFYELELDAAQTYASRFFSMTQFVRAYCFPQVDPQDEVVVIGSQVANASARAILGEGEREEPLLRIVHGGWRAELHWNLVTPVGSLPTRVTDFAGPRRSLAHVIHERGHATPYASRTDAAGIHYLDDYLLVTCLPRRKDLSQRMLIFAGLHGPGTRALDLILREPPVDELARAARTLAGARHYQMLLHVDTTLDSRGEAFPVNPTLVDARALIVE